VVEWPIKTILTVYVCADPQMTVQFCVQDHLRLVTELSDLKLSHLADLVQHLVSSLSLSLAVFKVDSHL